MKNSIIALFACACISLAMSAAEPVLIFHIPGQSEPVKVPLTASTSIEFSQDGGTITITDDEHETPMTFNTDDVEKVTFNADTGSIDDLEADLGGLTIENHQGHVTLTADGPISYAAWTIAGHSVFSGSARNSVELNFTELPSGIYILKANDKVIKFTNK